MNPLCRRQDVGLYIRQWIRQCITFDTMAITYPAVAIDPRHFCYVCPYNAEVCPAVVHRHGSRWKMNDRNESRNSHCPGDAFGRIVVVIDARTVRKTVYIKKNGTMSFKKYRT